MATFTKDVSTLTDVEKFELLDSIWMDLEVHPFTVSPAQAAELDSRTAAYERDRTVAVPWEQVKAGRPKFGSAGRLVTGSH